VDLRVGLDAVEHRKIPCPYRRARSPSLYELSYNNRMNYSILTTGSMLQSNECWGQMACCSLSFMDMAYWKWERTYFVECSSILILASSL
jgi:hypothetical protein